MKLGERMLEWQITDIQAGLEDLEKGNVISQEEMVKLWEGKLDRSMQLGEPSSRLSANNFIQPLHDTNHLLCRNGSDFLTNPFNGQCSYLADFNP